MRIILIFNQQRFQMKSVSIILLLFPFTIFLISACDSYNPTTSENNILNVSTSIFPLYDITRQIGGTKVKVHLLIEPGESPHTFEPTFTTKNNIHNSKKLFVIGHQIDN